MKVFKATREDMTCTRGKGRFQYRLGIPSHAKASKCGGTGLHACEYVIDCLRYYDLKHGNRFFLAEAEGDIAEDGIDTRISCTTLTLLKELNHRDIAREAIRYMVAHPKRSGWEKSVHFLMISNEEANAENKDGIAIARGEEPRVKGVIGSHLGLIRENEKGINAARLFEVDGTYIKPDEWYTIEKLEEAAGRAGR